MVCDIVPAAKRKRGACAGAGVDGALAPQEKLILFANIFIVQFHNA
jgi:hypothetical protein